MIQAIFARLERDGDCAARLTPALLAASFGWRAHTVERAFGAMTELGVLQYGVVASEWRLVRTPDAKPDASDENRTLFDPATGHRAYSENASSARSRRKYWRDKEIGARPSENRTPVRKPDAQPSLSFLREPIQEQENKQTTAPASDDGFGELRSLWPLPNRMTEAEREHRRYRALHTAPAILAAARSYLDTKPEWRTCMFLVHWLRTDPCRDPQLPLSAPPRAIQPTRVGERPRDDRPSQPLTNDEREALLRTILG